MAPSVVLLPTRLQQYTCCVYIRFYIRSDKHQKIQSEVRKSLSKTSDLLDHFILNEILSVWLRLVQWAIALEKWQGVRFSRSEKKNGSVNIVFQKPNRTIFFCDCNAICSFRSIFEKKKLHNVISHFSQFYKNLCNSCCWIVLNSIIFFFVGLRNERQST